ncbi:hypothetical protein [Clostridium beijerinckii]|uniref:Circularly permuted ATP-grasp superfamily protein n=1 Tax=Clostridium beijerinckii TaxID=1520 RepID=A0AAE5LSS7_CLOBE|nr:hypothetical protein [Clostridium beijerinckii]NSB17466.1 putative circularly permuted ATP-grasp superfamily protein [Clostridium beijerinckii]OOM28423.1 hypothetical protein CLOBE_26790 [Clostridium beijerinckii]
MEIELEKRDECILNTQDEFKEFFKNKKYNITEDEQKIEALFKGHEVILKQNSANEEYLMGANTSWTLINSKYKSKHTIAVNIKKNNNQYVYQYTLKCDTNYTIEDSEFKSIHELLTDLFSDL